MQLQQVLCGSPIQDPLSSATRPKQSGLAKPVGTKNEGIQKKYNAYLCESPSATPTTAKATNPVVYVNVPTGADDYMHMESRLNSPPPLPHKKQGTPIAGQEEIYDNIP